MTQRREWHLILAVTPPPPHYLPYWPCQITTIHLETSFWVNVTFQITMYRYIVLWTDNVKPFTYHFGFISEYLPSHFHINGSNNTSDLVTFPYNCPAQVWLNVFRLMKRLQHLRLNMPIEKLNAYLVCSVINVLLYNQNKTCLNQKVNERILGLGDCSQVGSVYINYFSLCRAKEKKRKSHYHASSSERLYSVFWAKR